MSESKTNEDPTLPDARPTRAQPAEPGGEATSETDTAEPPTVKQSNEEPDSDDGAERATLVRGEDAPRETKEPETLERPTEAQERPVDGAEPTTVKQADGERSTDDSDERTTLVREDSEANTAGDEAITLDDNQLADPPEPIDAPGHTELGEPDLVVGPTMLSGPAEHGGDSQPGAAAPMTPPAASYGSPAYEARGGSKGWLVAVLLLAIVAGGYFVFISLREEDSEESTETEQGAATSGASSPANTVTKSPPTSETSQPVDPVPAVPPQPTETKAKPTRTKTSSAPPTSTATAKTTAWPSAWPTALPSALPTVIPTGLASVIPPWAPASATASTVAPATPNPQ